MFIIIFFTRACSSSGFGGLFFLIAIHLIIGVFGVVGYFFIFATFFWAMIGVMCERFHTFFIPLYSISLIYACLGAEAWSPASYGILEPLAYLINIPKILIIAIIFFSVRYIILLCLKGDFEPSTHIIGLVLGIIFCNFFISLSNIGQNLFDSFIPIKTSNIVESTPLEPKTEEPVVVKTPVVIKAPAVTEKPTVTEKPVEKVRYKNFEQKTFRNYDKEKKKKVADLMLGYDQAQKRYEKLCRKEFKNSKSSNPIYSHSCKKFFTMVTEQRKNHFLKEVTNSFDENMISQMALNSL